MEPIKPEGEFHHFQMVDAEGEIPFSISVLVHYNNHKKNRKIAQPLNADDIIEFHQELQEFDGDITKLFSGNKKSK